MKKTRTYKTKGDGVVGEGWLVQHARLHGVRETERRLGIPRSTISDAKKRLESGRSSQDPPPLPSSRASQSRSTACTKTAGCGGGTTPCRGNSSTSRSSEKYSKLVIIPDAHAHPEYDNDRFEILGNFLSEEAPGCVVCIGDFADMPSLSSYDRGTRGFEGRRYAKDVEASLDALGRLEAAWGHDSDVRKVMTYGNHENRIVRVTNSDAAMHGTIGVGDLGFEEDGWETYPFLQPVSIGGINFSHYFVSGVMGRAISGVHIGSSLCTKLHQSGVQGHSHLLDHAERTRPDGQKIFGLSVGCYTHKGMVEDWNAATAHTWWRGVVVLEGMDGEGYYDEIRFVTQRRMMEDYS